MSSSAIVKLQGYCKLLERQGMFYACKYVFGKLIDEKTLNYWIYMHVNRRNRYIALKDKLKIFGESFS